MYKLIIQDDEGKTTVVPLIRDEITIGRKEGNTIRLTERNVSRRHARIVRSNGSVVVEDLESYNGVKVNGARIQGRVAVNESDRIQIGDYLLELKMERAAGDVTPGMSSSGQFPHPSGSGNMPQAGSSPPPIPISMQPTPAVGSPGMAMPQNGSLRNAAKTTAPMAAFGAPDPTAPMAAGTPAPELATGAEGPGRLVVVSSNFGGREHVLDKAVMVIGRTDDNDIVINHRSISRHHAKIVLEQGRYCIVDMQSSNGVRVNGEDYGKVELRRGDMIDLGHVRMRYVDPGEDFIFARDAQLVDVAVRDGKGKGALIAAASVVVVGALAAVIFIVRGSSGTSAAVAANDAPTAAAPAPSPSPSPTVPPEPALVKPVKPSVVEAPVNPPVTPPGKPLPTVIAAGAPDAGAGAVVTAPPTPPPPEVAPPPPSVPAKDVAALVAEARDAMTAEKWVAAIAAAEQALKVAPDDADAKQIQERANAEFRAQTIYEKLVTARDAGKAAEVAKLVKELPDTSVYKAKATADLQQMHDQYIREREADARRLSQKGQCDSIQSLARRSGDVFPDARAAVERAGAGCTPIAVVAPPERPTEPEKPRAPALTAAPTEAELSALVTDAKEAARNGNWADARKKADDVLRYRPGDQDALSVGGIAACNLLDRDRATRYIDRLKGNRQTMMKQICASKGLTIE